MTMLNKIHISAKYWPNELDVHRENKEKNLRWNRKREREGEKRNMQNLFVDV